MSFTYCFHFSFPFAHIFLSTLELGGDGGVVTVPLSIPCPPTSMEMV